MAETREFHHRTMRRFILQIGGNSTNTTIFGGGAFAAHHEDHVLNLPVDTRYQRPLRGTDGSRIYPAGYGGAGEGPAGG